MMTHKHTAEAKRKISENNAKYWLGKKRSPETVEKVRKANTGRKYLNRKKPTYDRPNPGWIKKGERRGVETEIKKGQRLSPTTEFREGENTGSKNLSWRGGITKPIQLLRKSDNYIQWRNAVYKRDNYTCWLCGKKGGRLEAHHIFSFGKYPQWRFEVYNGVTLHQRCHPRLPKGEKEFFERMIDLRLERGIGVVDI